MFVLLLRMKNKEKVSVRGCGQMVDYNQLNSIEQVLDSTTLLEIELIQILENSTQKWVSTKEVSEYLQISTGSALRIIERTNENIEILDIEGISFLVSKGKGISLEIEPDKDVQVLISLLMARSPIIQLMDSIFKEEVRSITQYAQEHFMSEATVRRNISKIREYVEKFDLSISRVNATLEGDEKQIRLVMMTFYWRIYGGLSWPFDMVDEKDMAQLTEYLLESLISSEKNISFLFIRQIEYYFAEAILRTRKKNMISTNDARLSVIAVGSRYERLVEAMKENNNRLVNVSEPELMFHYAVSLSMSSVYHLLKPETVRTIMADHERRKTPIAESMNLALEKLDDYFPVAESKFIQNKEVSAALFNAHCFAYLFKGFNSDMNGRVYTYYFSRNYPNLTGRIYDFIDHLYHSSKNEIFLEKDFLVMPYMEIITQTIDPIYFEEKIMIVIETELPMMLEKYIIQRIEFIFKDKFNLQFVSISEKYDIAEIDVVLTTMAIENLIEHYSTAKVLKINRTVTDNDLQRMDMLFRSIKK
jgi:hypothetical protein